MPTYHGIGYRWTGYNIPSTPELTITITDDDAQMDWFGSGDANQLVTTSDGNHTNAVVNGGSILNVRMDTNNDGIQDVIEPVAFFQVAGQWYWLPTPGSSFETGDTLLGNAGGWVDSGTGWDYEDITCFGADTLIDTPQGPRRISDLSEGDLVNTDNGGEQTVEWIGKSTVKADGDLAPIIITKGTFNNDRDIAVSPNHAILVEDWRAELLLGTEAAFIRAKDLVNGDTIYRMPQAEFTYYHLLLKGHFVLQTSGMLSESFYPGPAAMQALSPSSKNEIVRRFPALCIDTDSFGPQAFAVAKSYEAACFPTYA
ncbi:Hint domain-containing protein [Sulfitobacter pacificus]|uniref:Hint domain-containing protein n=1 Tax=Sulfitobacter pacificus TaxID=1499314 RepID=UPI003107EE6F